MCAEVDVVVVGAGIAGLAHALAAHRLGRSVLVLERSPRSVGASVRNFGMIWPIGQPDGPMRNTALRSRQIWIDVARSAGFWLSECGSMHLAHHDDEMAVLSEFVAASEDPSALRLCDPATVREFLPWVNPQGLRGGLFSRTECAVDPRQALERLAAWLSERPGVEVRFATPVRAVESARVLLADGTACRATHVFVCTGEDHRLLFPEVFHAQPVRLCKLQMMRTLPQPGTGRLGLHAAGGSTLRHYPAFANCPSLPAVRERFRRERPEFDRRGIHVMASQNHLGEVVIGDSHEYGDVFDPDSREDTDAMILEYLAGMLTLPDPRPAARWHGVYLKHTLGEPALTAVPQPGVHVFNALGGNGMTLGFALAEQHVRQALG
ncbi:MAG: TIGR03364 family FAD-dependent oxidoreductase [Phycisphaerales bacterium]